MTWKKFKETMERCGTQDDDKIEEIRTTQKFITFSIKRPHTLSCTITISTVTEAE